MSTPITTVEQLYEDQIKHLPVPERLRLVALVANDLTVVPTEAPSHRVSPRLARREDAADFVMGVDVAPLQQDPCHAWVDAHRQELSRFRGERVLIHPTRGVIAFGSFGAVYDTASRLGAPDRDELLLTAVPLDFLA